MAFQLKTSRSPITNEGLGSWLYRSSGTRQVARYLAPLFGVLALTATGILGGCETLESLDLRWQTSDTASDSVQFSASEQKSLVARAQRGLTALGYLPGPADGVPGRKTGIAVRAYQKKAGLRVNRCRP